jgi:hypothetical protein
MVATPQAEKYLRTQVQLHNLFYLFVEQALIELRQ